MTVTGDNANESRVAVEFRGEGYATIPAVLAQDVIEAMGDELDRLTGPSVRRRTDVFGVRNVLALSERIRDVVVRPEVWRWVVAILGADAFAIRATFFDKTAGTNWALGWHRDRAIAVSERHEVSGFRAWDRKAGVWHVQPPADVLRRMLALRIHLDDCGPENGPLCVKPRSHRPDWDEDDSEVVTCCVGAGGIVAMCPYLLHASSRATVPGHRRVVHVELANEDLPHGLDWQERIVPGG